MPSWRCRRWRRSARAICAAARPNATFEAGLKERVVVTEWPSLAKAVEAHDAPAYQAALAALGDGAVRDIRIIRGWSERRPTLIPARLAAASRAASFGEAGSRIQAFFNDARVTQTCNFV